MKKSIFPAILLCAVTLTGCWYDDDCYIDSESASVCAETTTETTAITEPDLVHPRHAGADVPDIQFRLH